MIKTGKDHNVLSDSETDQIMLLLESAYHRTGDESIFRVMEILFTNTIHNSINANNQDNQKEWCSEVLV